MFCVFLCVCVFVVGRAAGLSTEHPTLAPTESPTLAPTNSPTLSPVASTTMRVIVVTFPSEDDESSDTSINNNNNNNVNEGYTNATLVVILTIAGLIGLCVLCVIAYVCVNKLMGKRRRVKRLDKFVAESHSGSDSLYVGTPRRKQRSSRRQSLRINNPAAVHVQINNIYQSAEPVSVRTKSSDDEVHYSYLEPLKRSTSADKMKAHRTYSESPYHSPRVPQYDKVLRAPSYDQVIDPPAYDKVVDQSIYDKVQAMDTRKSEHEYTNMRVFDSSRTMSHSGRHPANPYEATGAALFE